MVGEREISISKLCLRCGHGRLSRIGMSAVIRYAIAISSATSPGTYTYDVAIMCTNDLRKSLSK